MIIHEKGCLIFSETAAKFIKYYRYRNGSCSTVQEYYYSRVHFNNMYVRTVHNKNTPKNLQNKITPSMYHIIPTYISYTSKRYDYCYIIVQYTSIT